MYILGISAFYHDSAAALIKDGKIIAAAQEERFTRKKHDPGFPTSSIQYCLMEAGITPDQVESVVFYDKPMLKFDRLLETYLAFAPSGLVSFLAAMPVWLKEKVFLKATIRRELKELGWDAKDCKIMFAEHHQSHAASAFFPSPHDEAVVLCMDGVGEWATTSAWIGKNNAIEPLWQINFPHSLGLLYSAFTYFAGFKVNSGEYKLMGLAPYGEPIYCDLIKNNLIDIKEDGSYRLNMDYFNFAVGLTMTAKKFSKLFGREPRRSESEMTQFEMDLAASIQKVTEEIVLKIGASLHKETGIDNLCLAGGVALNCVANGRLLREGPFKNVWIQPASGDAGGSLGAAMVTWYQYHNNERITDPDDSMQAGYLGPEYSPDEIQSTLDGLGAKYTRLTEEQMVDQVSSDLSKESVVGWFQGRMEFGPRALGNRSIIGDARSEKMQSTMNLKIKFRESFRPFAPIVLEDDAKLYFKINAPSPYMLVVAPVVEKMRKKPSIGDESVKGLDQLKQVRSAIPAVTHVDYSARVQTVNKKRNAKLHSLLTSFKEKSASSVLINTSFNVRGEPIVCTPLDAYRCFMNTHMDVLVLDNFVMKKEDQPQWNESVPLIARFALD